MPPVDKSQQTNVRKDVEFVAKDDDEQVASGIVMVPDKVDLQNDFVREDQIRAFADQFENFIEVGEADGGVMHAVFPSEHSSLKRNEVLDEPTEIGGQTVSAGAWVQDWKVHDDELWGLIADGILEGYSIGAVNVDWAGPFDQDDLDDDVEVPEEVGDDWVWQIVGGLIREVSKVDIPAVPDAEILETKSDSEKRLADHLGNRDGFIAEAQERGHSEAEAERLWEYLNDAVNIEGAGDPGKSRSQSVLARVGKAALSALSRPGSSEETATARATDSSKTDARTNQQAKEGRTLSAANRESAMAAVDANLDLLEDAGVEHGMTRFTDRDSFDFNLTEHAARDWSGGETDDDSDEEDSSPFDLDANAKDAPGGEMPDNDTTMSKNDDPWKDAPAWAKDLRDGQKENSERIDEITASDEPGDGGEEKDAWEDAPEWAEDLKAKQEDHAERIDTISQQTGTTSQQLGKTAGEDQKNGSGPEFTLDPRKTSQ